MAADKKAKHEEKTALKAARRGSKRKHDVVAGEQKLPRGDGEEAAAEAADIAIGTKFILRQNLELSHLLTNQEQEVVVTSLGSEGKVFVDFGDGSTSKMIRAETLLRCFAVVPDEDLLDELAAELCDSDPVAKLVEAQPAKSDDHFMLPPPAIHLDQIVESDVSADAGAKSVGAVGIFETLQHAAMLN